MTTRAIDQARGLSAAIVSDLGWKMESGIAFARALFPGPLAFLVTPATIVIVVAAAYILTWLVPVLHAVVGPAPWPVSLIAAPWTVAPLVIVMMFLRYRLTESHDPPTGGRVGLDAVN